MRRNQNGSLWTVVIKKDHQEICLYNENLFHLFKLRYGDLIVKSSFGSRNISGKGKRKIMSVNCIINRKESKTEPGLKKLSTDSNSK